MAMKIEYFHKARIELAQECVYHPELKEFLANHPAEEFELKLAEIAAYLDIVLDGDYTQAQLDNLCNIMIWKLRSKRMAQIGTINSSKNNKPSSS
jgi:hypothetical protein